MPKIVQSMLKALGRQPSKAKLDNIDTNSGTSSSGGSGGSGGSRREKPTKRRKSVLDADSFVFLPETRLLTTGDRYSTTKTSLFLNSRPTTA